MKRLILCAALALCAVAALCAVSHAAEAEAPVFSKERLQLGAGVNTEWFSAGAAEAPALAFRREFSAGLYGAYNIVPALDVAGSCVYGLDNRFVRTSLGLRFTFFAGGDE